MKKRDALLTAIVGLALTGAAAADLTWDPDLDLNVNLGNFTVKSDANGPQNFETFQVSTWDEGVVGFSFEADFTGLSGEFSYGSDVRLRIYHNGDLVSHIGGFTDPGAPWDFDGFESDLDGFYAHGVNGNGSLSDGNPDWSIAGVDGSGENIWTFEFSNGWHSDFASDITLSNAMLRIHFIPTPGALALLALAGMVGSRRRLR